MRDDREPLLIRRLREDNLDLQRRPARLQGWVIVAISILATGLTCWSAWLFAQFARGTLT
jgi:hypothetical protein